MPSRTLRRITTACAVLTVLALLGVLAGVRVGELGALGTLAALALVPADLGAMTAFAERQQRQHGPPPATAPVE